MFDTPQLIRDYQMASEQHYKPPSYPPSSLEHQQQQQLPQHEVHNHWHQTTAPRPSRKPWHRRRGCVATLGVASVFILIAVSVGIALAVVYALKSRDRGQHDGAVDPLTILTTTEMPTPVTTWIPSSTTEATTTTTSSTSNESTTSTPWESTVTVIITASESSEAVETATATLTVTASEEEDLGLILSSMLSDFTRLSITTEVVTVSVTPTQPTTSTTSTTTSSSPASSSTIPDTFSTSPAPPSIATDSNLAAVSLNKDSSTPHRLLIWQDEFASLIASDLDLSASIASVYHLANHSSSELPRALQGTPLTAVTDGSGAPHLFYLADDGSITHLVQRQQLGGGSSSSSWTAQARSIRARSKSSLSATWHNENSTRGGAVVLVYQGSDDSVFLLYGVEEEKEENLLLVNISDALALETGDWDRLGLAVTSARSMSEEAEDDDGASLQILVEGRESVLTAECLMVSNEDGEVEADCYWLTSPFTNDQGKPIPVTSHPTYLSWSITTTDGGVSTIRGFFTLEDKGHTLTDHQLVPDQSSRLVSYGISQNKSVESMVMVTDETLFALIDGTQVWEFQFDGEDSWLGVGEIDTRITE